MKTIFYSLVLLCTVQVSLSQTFSNIVPLENGWAKYEEGAYYKDISGLLLTPFVGTWKYSNPDSTTILIIKLKRILNYNFGNHTKDMIIGEWYYKENGVEKINTLADIDVDLPFQFNHRIAAYRIINTKQRPPCNECDPSEKRVDGRISDDFLGIAGEIYFRHLPGVGPNSISVLVRFEGIKYFFNAAGEVTGTQFVGSTLPNGKYTLVKQP